MKEMYVRINNEMDELMTLIDLTKRSLKDALDRDDFDSAERFLTVMKIYNSRYIETMEMLLN